MGREVRMVPADWQHPRYPADHYEARRSGRYIPLYEHGFAQADAEWSEGFAKWSEGLVRQYGVPGKDWRDRQADDGPRFTEWHGARPSPDDYMPDWPAEQRTHLMMYEDTSEGTPISPAFADPEALARWLADTGASAFGGETAPYEAWLRICHGGWAPSMVVENGVMKSGVAALSTTKSGNE
jgi:hypothetical protein